MMTIVEQYQGYQQSESIQIPTSVLAIPSFQIPSLSPLNTDDLQNTITHSPNEVLGKRIESFFEYHLLQSTRYSIIAKNIQVFQHKTTIGELDFMVKERTTGQLLHVELCYKFYLFDPIVSKDPLSCWIGPNRKDNLLKKVQKLAQKQFPLLYTEAAKTELQKLGVTALEFQQQYCMLGQLFLPFSDQKLTSLGILNTTFDYGYWMDWATFEQNIDQTALFHIPEKKDWVVAPECGAIWEAYTTMLPKLKRLLEKRRSPLLWMKNNTRYTRLFVVWW